MKIGIPSGLLYFSYYPLWKTFFEELGAQVVISGNTNKKILDDGVKLCVDEACLPVKIYHGHIKSLIDKVDTIFIPRIMSISRNEYICPKFCGLPDMVRNSIPNMPPIIDSIINLRKSEKSIIDSMIDAASLITHNRGKIMNAYKKAQHKQRLFDEKLSETGDFPSAAQDKVCIPVNNKKKIGLIGHPYNVYDNFINMNIIKKLNDEGYSVLTIEMINPLVIEKKASIMPKRHFWTFGKKIIGAGLSFMDSNEVDGIIYLSSFACGIDSLMEDYLERQIRRDGRVPYMKITLDEHSGEAGLNTRLEAFLDMVRWREENESNFSSYGRSVCSGQRLS